MLTGTAASAAIRVALYIATTVPDRRAAGMMRVCRDFALDRGWTVEMAECDSRTNVPLEERPGWRKVDAALQAGVVGGIVTRHPDMVSEDSRQFINRFHQIRNSGGLLVVASPPGGAR